MVTQNAVLPSDIWLMWLMSMPYVDCEQRMGHENAEWALRTVRHCEFNVNYVFCVICEMQRIVCASCAISNLSYCSESLRFSSLCLNKVPNLRLFSRWMVLTYGGMLHLRGRNYSRYSIWNISHWKPMATPQQFSHFSLPTQEHSLALLQLLSDLDELLSSNDGFLLGPWLESAKSWGVTDSEKQLLEWNARLQITLWGETPQGITELSDYANREWGGLVSSFYKAR